MEILRIAAGTVAVHSARLVIICATQPAGRVMVRYLASGEMSDVPAGELSARTTPAREADATRLHAQAVQASPKRYRAAEHRERVVVAALVRTGKLNVAVEQTAAVSGVSARTLWRWIARYRARQSTTALLLEAVGVAPKARRISVDSEREINASIDFVFLTQPRGTYHTNLRSTI